MGGRAVGRVWGEEENVTTDRAGFSTGREYGTNLPVLEDTESRSQKA